MTKQHNYNVRYINVAAINEHGSPRSTQILTNDKHDAIEMMDMWMRRPGPRIVSCVIYDTGDNSTLVFSIKDNYARCVQGGK